MSRGSGTGQSGAPSGFLASVCGAFCLSQEMRASQSLFLSPPSCLLPSVHLLPSVATISVNFSSVTEAGVMCSPTLQARPAAAWGQAQLMRPCFPQLHQEGAAQTAGSGVSEHAASVHTCRCPSLCAASRAGQAAESARPAAKPKRGLACCKSIQKVKVVTAKG